MKNNMKKGNELLKVLIFTFVLLLSIPTSIITETNAIEDGFYFNNPEDIDGDGLNFTLERSIGTNIRKWDSDGDGISDGDEYYIYGTDPTRLSTDGDLYDDGQEIFGYSSNGDMPNYVEEPGNRPFVAAYPEIKFEISDDIDVFVKKTITSTSGTMKTTEATYGTSSTEGYSSSVAETEGHSNYNYQETYDYEYEQNYTPEEIELNDKEFTTGQVTTLGVSNSNEIQEVRSVEKDSEDSLTEGPTSGRFNNEVTTATKTDEESKINDLQSKLGYTYDKVQEYIDDFLDVIYNINGDITNLKEYLVYLADYLNNMLDYLELILPIIFTIIILVVTISTAGTATAAAGAATTAGAAAIDTSPLELIKTLCGELIKAIDVFAANFIRFIIDMIDEGRIENVNITLYERTKWLSFLKLLGPGDAFIVPAFFVRPVDVSDHIVSNMKIGDYMEFVDEIDWDLTLDEIVSPGHSIELISNGNSDMSDIGLILNQLKESIEYQPVLESAKAHGAGEESSYYVTTENAHYHETSIVNTETIGSSEFWSNSITTKTDDAADINFLFNITNVGTDVARKIENIRFEIYLGEDNHPITYPSLEDNLQISNLFPGEFHTFSVNPGISITSDQLKSIDMGERIRIVLKDYSYGEDELFYQNAYRQNVLFEIENGDDLNQEKFQTFLCYIGENDTYVDSLKYAIPVKIDNSTIISIWDRPITESSWWNIHLSNRYSGNFINAKAKPMTKVIMRYFKDSDGDGYNDKFEYKRGYDWQDHLSHPNAELMTRVDYEDSNDEIVGKITLSNHGDHKASGVQVQIFSPDYSTTIHNGLSGGAISVEPGSAIGPLNDIIQYEVNTPNYQEPYVLMKYNQPSGHEMYIIETDSTDINDFNNHSKRFNGIDPIIPYMFPVGEEQRFSMIVENPTNNTWRNMNLIIKFLSIGGQEIYRNITSMDIFPGMNLIKHTWLPYEYITDLVLHSKIKIMLVLTDYQNMIVDTTLKTLFPIGENHIGDKSTINVYPEEIQFGNIKNKVSFTQELTIVNSGLMDLEVFIESPSDDINLSIDESQKKADGIYGPIKINPVDGFSFFIEINITSKIDDDLHIKIISSDTTNGLLSIPIKFTIEGGDVESEERIDAVDVSFISQDVNLLNSTFNYGQDIMIEYSIHIDELEDKEIEFSVYNGTLKDITKKIKTMIINTTEKDYYSNFTISYDKQECILLYLDSNDLYEESDENNNIFLLPINIPKYTSGQIGNTTISLTGDYIDIQLNIFNSTVYIYDAKITGNNSIRANSSEIFILNSSLSNVSLSFFIMDDVNIRNSWIESNSLNINSNFMEVYYSKIINIQKNGTDGIDGSAGTSGGSPEITTYKFYSKDLYFESSSIIINSGNGGQGGNSTSSQAGAGGNGGSIETVFFCTNISINRSEILLTSGSGGDSGWGTSSSKGGDSGGIDFNINATGTTEISSSDVEIVISNSGNGADGFSNSRNDGGDGGKSGSLKFLFYCGNGIIDDSDIQIQGGFGGNGGDGYDTESNNVYGGEGGNGGNSGDLQFYLNSTDLGIMNSIIEFLHRGGGYGGDGGRSYDEDDSENGGHGGNGGKSMDCIMNIIVTNLSVFESIIKNDNLRRGSGGNGGRSYEKRGGNGGDGGQSGNSSINIVGQYFEIINSKIDNFGMDAGRGGRGGRGGDSDIGGLGGKGGDVDANSIILHYDFINITCSEISNYGGQAGNGGDGGDGYEHYNDYAHGNNGNDGGSTSESGIFMISQDIITMNNIIINYGQIGGDGGDGGDGDEEGRGGHAGDGGTTERAIIVIIGNNISFIGDQYIIKGKESKNEGEGGNGGDGDGNNAGNGGDSGKVKNSIMCLLSDNLSIVSSEIDIDGGVGSDGGDGGDSDPDDNDNSDNAGSPFIGGNGGEAQLLIDSEMINIDLTYISMKGGDGGWGGSGGDGDSGKIGANGGLGGMSNFSIQGVKLNLNNSIISLNGGIGGRGGRGGDENDDGETNNARGGLGGNGGDSNYYFNFSKPIELFNSKIKSFGGLGGEGGPGGNDKAGHTGGAGGDSKILLKTSNSFRFVSSLINSTGGKGGPGGEGDDAYSGGNGGNGGDGSYHIYSISFETNGFHSILNPGSGGDPGVSESGTNYGLAGLDGDINYFYYTDDLSLLNATFNHGLNIYNDTHLMNVSAPMINNIGDNTIYDYYWAIFNVQNEYDYPINNSTIKVWNETDFERTIITNNEGMAKILLLGRIWNNTEEIELFYFAQSSFFLSNRTVLSSKKTLYPDENLYVFMTLFYLYPDLKILNLTISKTGSINSRTGNITIKVINDGMINVRYATLKILEISNKPHEIEEITIENINSGSEFEIFTTLYRSTNNSLIKAVIDPNNDIHEIDESKNQIIYGTELEITNMSVSDDSILSGDLVDISVEVINVGDIHSPFNLISLENDKGAILAINYSVRKGDILFFNMTINTTGMVNWVDMFVRFDPNEIIYLKNPLKLFSFKLFIDKDTDLDGIPDSIDLDIDGDGYNNTDDGFPYDLEEWLDTDEDGIGNNADTDDDGDGYPDLVDPFPLNPFEWVDTDGDGIGDNTDTDDDGDGVPDYMDFFPKDPTLWENPDGDRLDNLSGDIYNLNKTMETILNWLESIDSNVKDINDELLMINYSINKIDDSINTKISFLRDELYEIRKNINDTMLNMNHSIITTINGLNSTLRKLINERCSVISSEIFSLNDSMKALILDLENDINNTLSSMNYSIYSQLDKVLATINNLNNTIGDKIDYNLDILSSLIVSEIEEMDQTIDYLNISMEKGFMDLNKSFNLKLDEEMGELRNAIGTYFKSYSNRFNISIDSLNNTLREDNVNIIEYIDETTNILSFSLDMINISLTHQSQTLVELQTEYHETTKDILTEVIDNLNSYSNQTIHGHELIMADIAAIESHLDSTDIDLKNIQEDLLWTNMHLMNFVNNETVFEFINNTYNNVTFLKEKEMELIYRTQRIQELYELVDNLTTATDEINKLYNNLSVQEDTNNIVKENQKRTNFLLIITLLMVIGISGFIGFYIFLSRKENPKKEVK